MEMSTQRKALYRKFETNIPEMNLRGLVPDPSICEQFIYSQDWSAYIAAAK
jgi:hypothetical protein